VSRRDVVHAHAYGVNLESLELSHCQQLSDIGPIFRLRRLKYLGLSGCTGITNLAPLAEMTKLEVLNITGLTVNFEIPGTC
jgi:internalin A